MWEFTKGALLSLVVNVLTILGWWYIGMWPPSLGNVTLALLILGFYGLEDQWAFPLGYWTVELLSIIVWLSGMGWAMGTGAGT
ncbi:MAG TPA: hypothetical protein VNT01_11845 [Symbiobacteriaceae bacterium]|nr:hypothetical protein [Symbiobacteriaceae bacterium]